MQHPPFSFELVRVNFCDSEFSVCAFSGRDAKAAFSETDLFNIKQISLVVRDCGAGGSTHTLSNFYKLRVKANRRVCVSFD